MSHDRRPAALLRLALVALAAASRSCLLLADATTAATSSADADGSPRCEESSCAAGTERDDAAADGVAAASLDEFNGGDGDQNDGLSSFRKDLQSAQSMTDEEILADAIKGVGYVVIRKKKAFVEDAMDGDDHDEEEGDEEEGECRDYSASCQVQAEAGAGRCLDNPNVLRKCPLSCKVCFREGVTPVRFGVEQTVDYYGNAEMNEQIIQNIKETRDYMFQYVYAEDRYEHVRNDCFNFDAKCSYYAATGWCDTLDGHDLRWMQEQCAPACQACPAIEYWRRCGKGPKDVDALKPRDLNAMLERIVGEYPEYNPRVLSRPELPAEVDTEKDEDKELEDDDAYDDDDGTYDDEEGGPDQPKPWIVLLENFLTPDQCDFFIAQGHRIGHERSSTIADEVSEDGEIDDQVEDDGRTSTNAWCDEEDCNDHYITREVMERILNMTGLPEANSEYIQLLRYEVGEWYHDHHDTVPQWVGVRHGPRILTVFLYLNDVESGGETRFTRLNDTGLDVVPRRGSALIWPNVLDDDLEVQNDWTFHEARPVAKGVKYGANVWFHLRNYRDNNNDDC